MPAPLDDLERGAVCLALYPFRPGFPLDRVIRQAEDDLIAQLDRHQSIESIEATIKPQDPPAEILTKVKLRRVLLLQDGTSPQRQDIMVARISSVTERLRARRGWYDRLKRGTHPTCLLIGHEARHGTNEQEAYLNTLTVSPISKAVILRRAGSLNQEEMRSVSERLLTTLELDISRLIQR